MAKKLYPDKWLTIGRLQWAGWVALGTVLVAIGSALISTTMDHRATLPRHQQIIDIHEAKIHNLYEITHDLDRQDEFHMIEMALEKVKWRLGELESRVMNFPVTIKPNMD